MFFDCCSDRPPHGSRIVDASKMINTGCKGTTLDCTSATSGQYVWTSNGLQSFVTNAQSRVANLGLSPGFP